MASSLTNNGKNVALNALAGVAVWASLHTDDPSTTGANEVSGGSPAYARKAATWAAASAGSVALAATFPVFDMPAGTVKYVGLWSASTAGTFYGAWDVTDESYASQGAYTITAGSVSL